MIKYNFQLDHIIISHWHSDHIGGVNNVLDMIPNKKGNIFNIMYVYDLIIFYIFHIIHKKF